jgi:hypothetical protein
LLISTAYSVHFDFAQNMMLGNIGAPQLAVSIRSLQPDTRQYPLQFVVIRTVAERLPKVGALIGEQARVQHAVCRQPRTAAVATKRLRHG